MITEQPVSISLSPVRRTWRSQFFSDFGADPRIEAFRERVYLNNGSLDSREPLPQISRQLSTVASETVTLGSGKTITAMEMEEAMAAFFDKWETEDMAAEGAREEAADAHPSNP